MFRATMCSSSGESVVLIRHLAYVTLCRWPSGMQIWMFHPYLHTRRSPTYARCRIDKTDSHDDEHTVARNMWSIEINIYRKEQCVRLVIYKNYPQFYISAPCVFCDITHSGTVPVKCHKNNISLLLHHSPQKRKIVVLLHFLHTVSKLQFRTSGDIFSFFIPPTLTEYTDN